ncbi:hypothetical protein ACFWE5_07265 [Cellulosimicrobium funkei]|uniref:hypothetical protein n=1 Tax=Cellulosimicrobium funkei TaxID=264251 RepID=UPI0036506C9D
MTGPATVTISAAEHDALLAIERAANVIAAGDLVDPHEAEQVREALPHLLEDLALTRPVTSRVTALADVWARRRRRAHAEGGVMPAAREPRPAFGVTNGGVVPFGAVSSHRPAPARRALSTEDWLSRMGRLGALSPEHQAAYEALAQAGLQPAQLRLLASIWTGSETAQAHEKGHRS